MRFRRSTAALATAVLAGLALAPITPDAAIAAKGTVAPRPFVTGWLPYWLPTTSTDAVVSHAGVFKEASPFVFDVQSAGEIDLKVSAAQWKTMRSKLRGAGVDIIPTMATDLSADQFAAILSNRTRRTTHVRTLARLAERYHVDGIDLDYESINFGSSSAKQTVKKLYPVFAQQLNRRLAKDGRILAITVASRTRVDDPNWNIYNYKALGAAADRFRIMTYDFHWSGGRPGPIAPKWWVNDVVSFAVTQVDPQKVSFGLPAYGRDWFVKTVSGNCPSSARTTISRSTRDMEKFASSIGKHPKWSDRGTSRTFTYTKKYSSGGSTCRAKRAVWFDDARSVAEKTKLVQKYEIRGVAMWALGYESRATWDKLRTYGQQIATREPNVKLSAPTSLEYGTDGAVTATVQDGGTAVAKLPVTLERRALGTKGWTAVGSKRTGSDGKVRFAVSPRQHVEWRVRTGRTWLLNRDTSAPDPTRVAYSVRAGDGLSALSRGTRWSLTGSVNPGLAGTTVIRQKYIDGAWVEKARKQANKDGSFTFSLRSSSKGEHRYRVVAAAGTLDRGKSAPIKVQVG